MNGMNAMMMVLVLVIGFALGCEQPSPPEAQSPTPSEAAETAAPADETVDGKLIQACEKILKLARSSTIGIETCKRDLTQRMLQHCKDLATQHVKCSSEP